jgi:type I restriction enzyme S subunit
MSSEWKEYSLDEVILNSNQGVNTTTENVEYSANGSNVIVRAKNISDYNIDLNDIVCVDDDTFNRLKPTVKPDIGDVLYTNIGSKMGSAAKVKTSSFAIAWNVFRIAVKEEKIDSDYLVYWLNDKSRKNYILNLNSSSTMPFVSGKVLRSMNIELPPVQEQKNIAHILGTLDDKIELNRKMNETLEQMAQALFKSWFVDFDPVMDNAIALGKEIPEDLKHKAERRKEVLSSGKYKALPKDIMDLFPTAFSYSDELDKWVPAGWEVKSLSEISTELRRGISPKYIDEGGVRVVNQKCIRNHMVNYTLCRRNDPSKKKVEGRLLEIHDMLVNSTGTGTLGRVANVLSLDEPTVVDSHVTVVRANKEVVQPLYLNGLLFALEKTIEAMGEGSTGQTELSRVRLGGLKVLISPINLQRIISNELEGIFSKMDRNIKLNETLVGFRDVLLPQLISGKLRVNNNAA